MNKFNFNPDDLRGLADKFGKIFDELLESDYYSINRYIPNMIGNINSSNDSNNYYYDILLPGYKKEHIKVFIEENDEQNVSNSSIKIEAESSYNKKEEDMIYDKTQFEIKSFNKNINLPKNATKEINASYENGILRLTVKKVIFNSKTTEVKID